MRFNEEKQKFEAYASVEEVLEIKTSSTRLDLTPTAEGTNLAKFAAAKTEGDIQDGYLYVRARAISSRVNKNNDGWPSEELIGAYRTFVGRPVFVDHNNSDPKRTRGVIVDSRLHVEDDEGKESALDPYYASAPDNHKPPTWIEILIEVDAETFPKLAKAVKKGDIDSVSMGANIDKSVCSVCHNEATIPSDYCSHVKQKGLTFEITADNGEKIQKKAYEDCYGVNFFEISFVFDPADETALNIETAEHELKLSASERGGDRDINDARICENCGGEVTPNNDTIGVEAECGKCGRVYSAEAYDYLPRRLPDGRSPLALPSIDDGRGGVIGSVKEAIGIGDSAFLLKQKGDYTEWPDESRARTRSIVQQRSPEMANHLQEVEDVISGLRSGDMNAALRAANILSANGFPQNPWLGMNAQDIVDRISSNLVTASSVTKEAMDIDWGRMSDDEALEMHTHDLTQAISLEMAKGQTFDQAIKNPLITFTLKMLGPNMADKALATAKQWVQFGEAAHGEGETYSVPNPRSPQQPQEQPYIYPSKILEQVPGFGTPTDAPIGGSYTQIYPGGPVVDSKGLSGGDYASLHRQMPKRINDPRWSKQADVVDPGEERELNHEPQDDKVKAPEKVDTLRDDIECPNCGVDTLQTDPDGVLRCPTCQYEQPPEGLDDPDLTKAQDKDDDERFNQGDDDKVEDDPDDDAIAKIVEKSDRKGGDSDPFISPIEPVRSSSTRKDIVAKGLINEMNWKQLVATDSIKEANASLKQVIAASVETTIENTGGIHFGTHSAMRSAGVSCTVQFPGAPQPAPIPGNAMMTFMFQQKAMAQLGTQNPGDVPITVTAPDEQLDEVLRIIHSGGDGPPGMGGPTAATKGKDKKPVVPGDKRSGDEPKGEKIVSDQIEPVTADRRVIKREESPDGHRTEHIVEETGELLEEEDKPKDEKKDSDAEETKDGNEAKPQAEREEDENDNRPDFLKNKDKQPAFASTEDKQGKLLAALAVADEAIDMGVIDKNKRLAFLGMLEEETIPEIEARRRTLALVKSAGLTNRRVSSRRTVLPRLSSNAAPSNGSVNLDDIPFEAIFTDGIQ